MMRFGRKPDVFTYSSVVAACRSSWEMAELILDNMPSDITPNILTYCSVMSSYVRVRQWQRALQVFGRLVRSYRPNAVAYTCAFQAMELAGPEWQLVGAQSGLEDVHRGYRAKLITILYTPNTIPLIDCWKPPILLRLFF